MSLWLTHPLFLPSLIVGVTIVLWATSLLPEFITALLFFAAAMMAKIAPPEVIFGGFASSAFWLVFSGFVLGIAIRKTGLADRAAQALSARLTDSWPRMVASVVLLSYALAFVMPSNMGRIALLMPIVAAMARRAGIADGSRGWFGLALAVGFGTFQLSATILPANVPNLVMSGAAEGSYGIHLNYVPYLLLQVMPLDKDNPFTSFLALTGITSALNFIMTANGVPALYTTFAQSFADATGFPLLSVIMIQVLGYSTPLLPYQASPIVVAMGLGKVPARAGMQLCLALAAVSYLILLPLDYAWYQLLGKL
ncbi:SLC13 family permease [Klebsiella pneumoniae]|uniref:SLC13 family permease n=1 Tax=Klebsiella pneumoniae TaxID=573 RepID=UPI000E2C47BD|nr:SLC13 family permease [Klebsiella pneumoniae]SYE78543.1 di- and tricarboxylate transporter [Klebsiella pneumoniae]